MADVRPIAFMRNRFVPFEEANVSIASAPVLYGLSIYTVFPLVWSEQEYQLYIFRLKDHFKRLQNSAQIMAFNEFAKNWDYDKFAKTMQELIIKNKVQENSLVRVSVFVDDILRGARMHGLKHSLCAFIYSTPPLLPETGASLMVSNWRRTADNAIPVRAKVNGGYVNSALMKHEAMMAGFDDALALDANGHLTESTVANVFLVRRGKLVTPHNSTDLLEGITRNTVFRLAEKMGIPCGQATIDRSEIYLADEIFLSGSSVQIAPITDVDRRQIGTGKPGPVTKKMIKAYAELVQKPNEYLDWFTPVKT